MHPAAEWRGKIAHFSLMPALNPIDIFFRNAVLPKIKQPAGLHYLKYAPHMKCAYSSLTLANDSFSQKRLNTKGKV